MRRLVPVLAAGAAALVAAVPAAAASWSPPATISAPHTFVLGLEAAPSANGTVVADWAFQDGIGNTATRGRRGASLAPGAPAFGPERALPRDVVEVVPYAQRSVSALTLTEAFAGARDRLAIAFGSADGPSLGTARTVVTEDIVFAPRLAMAADGSGLVAWIARASGDRRIVRVALRAPGARFGAPSTISGTGRADAVTAAVGPQGQRVVAFVRAGRLFARYRPAGGSWRPIQDLGAVAAGTENRLAALITSGGRVTVVDVHRQLSEGGSDAPLLVDAWVQGAGRSRFGAVQRLQQADGVQASAPALVLGDGRGAVLAWVGAEPGAAPAPGGPTTRVLASVQGSDGRFRVPLAVSPPGRSVSTVSAAGTGATTIVSWVGIDAPSDISGQVLASVRPGGGAFGPAEEVSPHEAASLTAAGFAGAGPEPRPFVAWAARPGGEGPGVPLAQIRTFVRVAQRLP